MSENAVETNKKMILASDVKSVSINSDLFGGYEFEKTQEIIGFYLSDHGMDETDAWESDELAKKLNQITLKYTKGYINSLKDLTSRLLPCSDFILDGNLDSLGIRFDLHDGTMIQTGIEHGTFDWWIIDNKDAKERFIDCHHAVGMKKVNDLLDYLFLPLIKKEKARIRKELSRLKKGKNEKNICFWVDKKLAKKIKLKAAEQGLDVGKFISEKMKEIV